MYSCVCVCVCVSVCVYACAARMQRTLLVLSEACAGAKGVKYVVCIYIYIHTYICISMYLKKIRCKIRCMHVYIHTYIYKYVLLHVPAGKGPHFLAEAQTQILGVLPDTLAEVEAFVETFWYNMRPHAEASACGRGGGGGLSSASGAASGGGT